MDLLQVVLIILFFAALLKLPANNTPILWRKYDFDKELSFSKSFCYFKISMKYLFMVWKTFTNSKLDLRNFLKD